jgi:A/G-specific adenine glycosylase
LKNPSPDRIHAFRKKIHDFHLENGRRLPWRRTRNPYRILVSEIMLQQTQVERVIEKYNKFLSAFPDFSSLANAPLPKLLKVWSGMGYNRRALALKALAGNVMNEHGGKLPADPAALVKLPGIGKYTAGAVMAFAFNRPVVFMDTNIRRVFIHEFFKDREGVRDEEIIPIVEKTLDRTDPKTWYNALMDYGAALKKEHGNPNRRSAHYARQSPFENSNRQVRGSILKTLLKESPLTQAQVVKKTGMDAERVKKNLAQLEKEGFIRKRGKIYSL